MSTFRVCEQIRRLNAELAEHAEKSPKHFFSAASAASALNVICSQTLQADGRLPYVVSAFGGPSNDRSVHDGPAQAGHHDYAIMVKEGTR